MQVVGHVIAIGMRTHQNPISAIPTMVCGLNVPIALLVSTVKSVLFVTMETLSMVAAEVSSLEKTIRNSLGIFYPLLHSGCHCSVQGSINAFICDRTTSQCLCRENVTGHSCNQRVLGTCGYSMLWPYSSLVIALANPATEDNSAAKVRTTTLHQRW